MKRLSDVLEPWSENTSMNRRLSAYMVWYLIFLHLYWGLILFIEPPAGVDASGGATWNIYVRFLGVEFWRVWFLLGSAMAAISLSIRNQSWRTALLLLPQQLTVIVAFIGVITNFAGYWDEFAMSRIHRQAPTALGPFIFHTLAFFELELWGDRRK